MVLGGELRGLGPARVNDDDLPAAPDDGLQASRRVRHRHQASVRDRGIGADDEQVARAVDVGHGDRGRERAAEEEPGRDLLREPIDRRGVEQAPARERAREHRYVEVRHLVGDRVTEVHADRVVAVLLPDRPHPRGDLRVRLLPVDLLPAARRPPDGAAEALAVGVELLHAVGLRADEAAGEGVALVAAHRDDRLALDLDREAAGGFAEGTDPVDRASFGHPRLLRAHTSGSARHRSL